MNNFSKFLRNKEDLIFFFASRGRGYSIYITILLLALVFFMLYPMWQFGRQGLGLWAVAVIFLLALLARQLLSRDKVYLFTTQRLVLLEKLNHDNFRTRGSIKLNSIEAVSGRGKKHIILKTGGKIYYILNVFNRDKVIVKIKAYLQL